MTENDLSQPRGAVLDYRSGVSSHSVLPPAQITFERSELTLILALYGRNVAAGEWRDYAIDFTKERAVFSVMARCSAKLLSHAPKSSPDIS